jgi:hypothetical protein
VDGLGALAVGSRFHGVPLSAIRWADTMSPYYCNCALHVENSLTHWNGSLYHVSKKSRYIQ